MNVSYCLTFSLAVTGLKEHVLSQSDLQIRGKKDSVEPMLYFKYILIVSCGFNLKAPNIQWFSLAF